MNSISHLTRTISRWPEILLWISGAMLVGLFYLIISAWDRGGFGFPLDDAWIHQTYARNLARSGQLAFVPGIPSAGSTAPLWSFLLSLGYLLRIPFKLWTYGLGLLFLGMTGWTVRRLSQHLFPDFPRLSLWTALFCLLEWHLVWAAVSGMETILFIWLSLFLVEQYHLIKSQSSTLGQALKLGLLGGLLILTRPEGIGLVGIIGLDIAYHQKDDLKTLIQQWLGIVIGVACFLIPYILFHLWATGLPFPNTFYAKQAEYGLILDTYPLWWRLFGNLGQPIESIQGVFRVIFIGPQLLLLPGLFFGAWITLKERRTELLPLWVWWTSFLVLYAIRLPVTYQHGRYQIPAIAWVILLGCWGTARMLQAPPTTRSRQVRLSSRIRRIVGPSLNLSLGLLIFAFTLIGAQAYQRDVNFIESEMVATAKWLHENTAADTLIAAHDIGAIGYFAQRPLIDLAGLITPEVIPFIRDEYALLNFIIAHRADYFVTFPSWYPSMISHPALEPVYRTETQEDNMTVYRLMIEQE